MVKQSRVVLPIVDRRLSLNRRRWR